MNTGIRHGIVVRLEEMLAKPLLQLACRHHIFELMCGAACRKVYGPTTGPTQASFKKLIAIWGDLDKVKCSSIQISQTNRYLASMVQETSAFLQQWLEKNDGQTLRHDYRELASLTLLFLGSTDPGDIRVKAPGAIHHARWMAKTLYTIKIALYRDQLQEVYSKEEIQEITSLAIFLALFYTEPWLTSTNAKDSPINDLKLLKKLTKTEESIKKNDTVWPAQFLSLVVRAREIFENHLWYLSERLIPFSLFSDNLDVAEKQQLRKTMMKFENSLPFAKQEMPFSSNLGRKTLKDFVGQDSWAIFQLLDSDSSFLKQPATKWETLESYQHAKKAISNLPVVNDAAERAFGLATETNTKAAPKSEEKLQALYQVIRGVREKLRATATSTEYVTKKSLAVVTYNWD